MLGNSSNGEQPSDTIEAQTEQQAQLETLRAAINADAQEMDDVEPDDLLESLSESALKEHFPGIYAEVSAHHGSHLVTSNYTEDDRTSIKAHNLALAKRITKERDQGRLHTGPFAEVAQGVHRRDDKSVKTKWTPDERRAAHASIFEERTAKQLLSIQGLGLRKIADTTVETLMKKVDGEGSKSRLKAAQERVFGSS